MFEMACAVCKSPVELIEHNYFDGLAPESAKSLGKTFPTGRTWTIIAPLYFQVSEDFRTCREGYCSARCASLRPSGPLTSEPGRSEGPR